MGKCSVPSEIKKTVQKAELYTASTSDVCARYMYDTCSLQLQLLVKQLVVIRDSHQLHRSKSCKIQPVDFDWLLERCYNLVSGRLLNQGG